MTEEWREVFDEEFCKGCNYEAEYSEAWQWHTCGKEVIEHSPATDDLVEAFINDFEIGMADGTLFRTNLNHNNMAVQYARTPDIQNWLRSKLNEVISRTREEEAKRLLTSDGMKQNIAEWKEQGIREERERILTIVRKHKKRVHKNDSEAFGYELLEDFVENSCCPGDDAAYGFEKACDEITKSISSAMAVAQLSN